jgi:hypothetical protein
MPDEKIRDASIWYLVRTYAPDPLAIKDPLRAALLEARAEASTREQFGRELLRRMLGAADRKDHERWQKFLATDEGKALFQNDTANVLQYLTEAEYRATGLPAGRIAKKPGVEARSPTLIVPSLLPAGLADALLVEQRCSDGWLGVANVTVDGAGRVQNADLKNVSTTDDCGVAAERIVRMSLATPTSILSQTALPIVLIRRPKTPLCNDEPPPDVTQRLLRVAGAVTPPTFTRRPPLGRDAKNTMVGEVVVTRDGCVRSARLIKQSPQADVNADWLLDLSRTVFAPATLDGKPIEAIFELSSNREN